LLRFLRKKDFDVRIFALIGVSGLLASCAVGPDYSRPDIPANNSFRMAKEAADLPSFANMPWWELYQDKELQNLIRIALEENKDLERAVATIEEFEARLFIARTDYIPQMAGTGNFPIVREGGVRFAGFPSPFSYYLQGNLAWEIDVWGRIRRSNEAARGDLLAREENRRAIILQLVSGVAQAYFDLRQVDLQSEIAERTLRAWDESVRISQARHRQGLIHGLDVEQFLAERENAAARIADLKRQMIQKENELSLLLGRNPGQIPRGQSLTDQVVPPVVPAGLPSELLQRRPDVVQAEQQLAAATARIGAAKADRFPKLSLTGLLGIANPNLSKLFLAGGDFGIFGPTLTGPLLNAVSLGFQQDAAEAQARQAVAQYKQTILTAFKEVEDALAGVSTAREQAAAQERQVNALKAALRLANLRYKGGLANYLDVLIAQRNLFDAELALATTQRLYLTSVVQLYKALGGGWLLSDHSREQPVAEALKIGNN
jgi:outer membrane protein, multidrug efflux system